MTKALTKKIENILKEGTFIDARIKHYGKKYKVVQTSYTSADVYEIYDYCNNADYVGTVEI